MTPSITMSDVPANSAPALVGADSVLQFGLRHMMAVGVVLSPCFAGLAYYTSDWPVARRLALLALLMGHLVAVMLIVLLFWLAERAHMRDLGEARCFVVRPLFARFPGLRICCLVILLYFAAAIVVGSVHGAEVSLSRLGVQEWMGRISMSFGTGFVIWVIYCGGSYAVQIHEHGIYNMLGPIMWSQVRYFEWPSSPAGLLKILLKPRRKWLPSVARYRVAGKDARHVRHWLVLQTGRLPGQLLGSNGDFARETP